jgi:AcrR family transcriptional regulator
MKKTRITNKERIIEAAITLMSERGGAVGTSQIAEYLKISPGNLYYHFRNREEIVREALALLRSELATTLAIPDDGQVPEEQLVSYYANGAVVLWRYRFLVASALELIHRDAELAEGYYAFSVESIEAIQRIITQVVKQAPGAEPANAKVCASLAENMWVLWNGWPSHAELYRIHEKVDQAAIAHGLEQIAMTLGPYVDTDYHNKVKRSLHDFVISLSEDAVDAA